MTPNIPAANRTSFNFSIDSNGPTLNKFSVYAFSGTETVSAPYEFSIELVSKNSNLDLTDMLGKEGLLTITDRSGGKRLVHGVIRQIEQLHTANSYTHYRCELVPRLWFLSQTQEHRIYQHQSVPQIVRTVLQRHNFSAEAYAFKLRETYSEREYVVQYGESDMHFLCRLCEEESIYIYFEHTKNMHCMCFSDAPGGLSIPGENSIRFYPGSGQVADTAVVSRLSLRHRINSDSSTYGEWNFTTPAIDLTNKEKEPDWDKAPVPQAMSLETYKFPHLYQVESEGDRYAKIQLQRQLTWREWIECESDVSRYLPGFTFTLHSHPRRDANRAWWLVSVHHEGEQPSVLQHEAPDRGQKYKTVFKAIPDDTRFVPEIVHKKVRIDGLQSALITGPAGEEVYVDKFGRVKAQFHWDRLGKHDENTTCWVRVADPWAGNNFGFIQVPRIGQEVLVEFMEGDPDRPVITGRAYNSNNMPPWQLPEQKTLSGIQSREFKAGRKNQLILDDTQGQIQAQLSSDHGLSQLNMGYLTRVNHIEGRKDYRGEGFELRTDNWGVMRAAKGLYVSTYARYGAEQHQTDVSEALKDITTAAKQHKDTGKRAETCNAQDYGDDCSPLAGSLDRQVDGIRGTGKAKEELSSAHLVLASPEGIALTTPKSTHLHTGEHTAISSERHTSISAGKSFLASALEKVSLFALSKGMRLMANKGKVEIEAQSDALNLIADKVMQIISAQERIHISAPKEIFLTAGGSYIRINESGIEEGTRGKWAAYASDHVMAGPKTKPWLTRAWKDGKLPENVRVAVRDEMGRYLDLERYAKKGTQTIPDGATEHKLELFHESMGVDAGMSLEQKDKTKGFAAVGTILTITGEYSNEDPAE